ncbi:carboxymethylenebutenolidase [Mycolicibacterium chubuense]|uniref:Dienelactone hydrolase family protein n=1 Tax=Mycolicibacterium chubuense TaxID=1800 RepID=A0A0J6VYS8_MYCCU|nr:dienelactone hydrolase family protein [Mycolicibacterium chubuense]KMO74613.1 Dienelactone hydrolase family protein [Mycolicibacterium chubuense]ORA44078.1 carboxymethylenebutenolidase [Mycolicibacterium chubuense]SPY46346.1 dienelactone hydrolase-like enzyme [Mycolicibacterium chubuense]
MAVINTSLRHDIDGTSYDAVLAHDDSRTAAQTVLVVHGMEGRSDLQLEFAGTLTEWGYQAVAVDLFGEEVTRGGMDATGAEMARFLDDRTALAQRLAAVFGAVTAAPQVAGTQLAAIGFCFGGLCVLDLARAGHPLAGVASFHGLLTAHPTLGQRDVHARVLVLHGWDDPFAPPEDVVALGREFSGRGIDWQLHAYGDTAHAFMAPWADDPARGILYSESASRRAWTTLGHFLQECWDTDAAAH